MISTKGSIFYQDSYQIIYESTWHTFDDCQIVDAHVTKKYSEWAGVDVIVMEELP